MDSLPGLPVELLRSICSQLCIEKDNRSHGHADISHLSRTCKQLQAIIQPLVFSTFAPEGDSLFFPKALQLIHALRLRPDLVQHLKYIDLTDINCDDSPSETALHLLSSIITNLNFQPLDSDQNIFSNRNPLPLIELLLLHTPNLTHLNLALSDDWFPHFLATLYRRRQTSKSNNPPPILPHLTTLTLTHHCISRYTWELGLPAFLTILHATAPNLRYLCTDNPGEELQAATAALGRKVHTDIYPPLPNLVHLEFDRVPKLHPEVLRGIVDAAPNLEVFALSTGTSWDDHTDGNASERYEGDCTVVDVWEVVWSRRGTLREVRLDVMHDGKAGGSTGGSLEFGGMPAWCGSLREFGRLEVLKVGNYALKVLREAWRRGQNNVEEDGFVDSLLPGCIREVTFWELDECWMDELRRLADVVASRPERYPNLTSVVVTHVPEDEMPREWKAKDEWLSASEDLEEQFRRAELRFEVKGVRGQKPVGPFETRSLFQF
ncbi:hypothetical protein B0T14DRAFT_567485 [Immersiella caudata]|uniref:F-box domain-containing protein n=1 Tax=Immersiella caudata TaxID=314043 RepID=A0AA39WSG6_9PEZI|nr:hypothetical protein B0T14DRAFT_567485 [Immersiella caudata]